MPSFLSSTMAIEDGWIDYNGHLNMAFYNVLFDRGADEMLMDVGLGPEAIERFGASYMTAEVHVCYLREVFRTDPVKVSMRILDLDDKRMHAFAELVHATEGWVSATSEQMYLSVDMKLRKVAPWHAEMRPKLEALKARSDGEPWPERAGRRIGIPRK